MSYLRFLDHPLQNFNFYGVSLNWIGIISGPVNAQEFFCMHFIAEGPKTPPSPEIWTITKPPIHGIGKFPDSPPAEFFKGLGHPLPWLFKWNSP